MPTSSTKRFILWLRKQRPRIYNRLLIKAYKLTPKFALSITKKLTLSQKNLSNNLGFLASTSNTIHKVFKNFRRNPTISSLRDTDMAPNAESDQKLRYMRTNFTSLRRTLRQYTFRVSAKAIKNKLKRIKAFLSDCDASKESIKRDALMVRTRDDYTLYNRIVRRLNISIHSLTLKKGVLTRRFLILRKRLKDSIKQPFAIYKRTVPYSQNIIKRNIISNLPSLRAEIKRRKKNALRVKVRGKFGRKRVRYILTLRRRIKSLLYTMRSMPSEDALLAWRFQAKTLALYQLGITGNMFPTLYRRLKRTSLRLRRKFKRQFYHAQVCSQQALYQSFLEKREEYNLKYNFKEKLANKALLKYLTFLSGNKEDPAFFNKLEKKFKTLKARFNALIKFSKIKISRNLSVRQKLKIRQQILQYKTVTNKLTTLGIKDVCLPVKSGISLRNSNDVITASYFIKQKFLSYLKTTRKKLVIENAKIDVPNIDIIESKRLLLNSRIKTFCFKQVKKELNIQKLFANLKNSIRGTRRLAERIHLNTMLRSINKAKELKEAKKNKHKGKKTQQVSNKIKQQKPDINKTVTTGLLKVHFDKKNQKNIKPTEQKYTDLRNNIKNKSGRVIVDSNVTKKRQSAK